MEGRLTKITSPVSRCSKLPSKMAPNPETLKLQIARIKAPNIWSNFHKFPHLSSENCSGCAAGPSPAGPSFCGILIICCHKIIIGSSIPGVSGCCKPGTPYWAINSFISSSNGPSEESSSCAACNGFCEKMALLPPSCRDGGASCLDFEGGW